MSEEKNNTSKPITTAGLWFDPACPWCWLTSRWAVEVMHVRPITVEFHIMSLYLLNKDHPGLSDQQRERMHEAYTYLRILDAVLHEFGQEKLSQMYTSVGTQIHHEKKTNKDTIYTQALASAGLSSDLLDAKNDQTHDASIAKSHAAGIEPLGNDVGVPTFHVNKTAFFGPVISRVPQGEEAGELWDGIVTAAKYPYFYELKRTRTEPAQL